MTGNSTVLHGTCVALEGNAALLRGEPGSGKSDLAYRFINLPGAGNLAGLIADDQVRLSRSGEEIRVSPPKSIAGKIELRGIGILEIPYFDEAILRLVIDLHPSGEIERLPDWTSTVTILGLRVPQIRLAPFEASSALKLRAAIKKISRNI